MIALRIKTGDTVIVSAGKDKGKKGKVIQSFPALKKVVVEGIAILKKHIKPRNKSEKGQTIQLAGPIHISKVSLWCEKCQKSCRVHIKFMDSKKERVCHRCESVFNTIRK